MPAAVGPRRTALYVLGGIAMFAYVLDVISKILIVRNVSEDRSIRLLGGLLHIVNIRNSGAAFSLGTGMTFVLAIIAIAIVVVILRTARRLRSHLWGLGLGLLLGGACGNLTDRLFRSPGVLRGHVVDWIQFPHFAIFNLADSAIVGGGILLGLLGVLGIELNGTRTTHRAKR